MSTGGCCKPDNQCGQDEGDCDNDTDCLNGYICGNNNCPSEFASSHDCCTTAGNFLK